MLRRLSLDLRMLVPTNEELEAFLADAEPGRWARWVQRFLNDPLHNERMVDWLDKTLLQRRPFQHVDRTKWLAYLRKSVDDQKPIDQIAREMVSSVWWNQSERAQQRFFLERAGDSHAIARDLGRVFFGKDMQCAQCHDHPQVDDYLQIDYHGLLAFVSPSSFVEAKFKDEKGAEQKLQIYVERAARDAPFESVFDKGIFYRTGVRAPGGTESFDPFQAPDESYQASPMPDSLDGAPAPPRFSRRNSLVAEFSAGNRYFATNWSNRLWAMLMGRGLVHPLDMHHPGNSPTNPKLLGALTEGLVASGFKIRPIIEQIVLSDAYKIGAFMPIETSLKHSCVVEIAEGVGAKLESSLMARMQLLESDSLRLSTAAEAAKQKCVDAESDWKTVQKERVELWAEVDKAEAKFKEVLKKTDTTKAAFEKAKKLHADAISRQVLLEEAAGKLEQARSLGLADDAELKQTIATTKAKADASKAMIPGLEKGVADATAARDTSNLALDAERTVVKDVAGKLIPVEQRLHTADTIFLEARNGWQSAQTEQSSVSNRLAALTRIQEWMTISRTVGIREKDLALAVQSLDQAKEMLTAQSRSLASLQQKVADLTLSKETVRGKLSKNQELQTESASKRAILKSTFDSIDSVLNLVSTTEPLIAAKQSIQLAIDSIDTTIPSVDANGVTLLTEFTEASNRLESESVSLAMVQKERLLLERSVEQGQSSVAAKSELVQQAIDSCSVAMQVVVDERQKSGHVAMTRPLSPEQLCLSVFQATGVLRNYIVAESTELEKQSPMAPDATSEQHATRRVQSTRQALDKLRSHVDTFANLFSSGVGQTSDEFFASPDQALFMANGGSVFQWSASSNNNVTGLIAQQTDDTIASKLLFRSLLSREPTADEMNWIHAVLSQAGEKRPAIAQELVWSLLSSSEFRVYP